MVSKSMSSAFHSVGQVVALMSSRELVLRPVGLALR